MQMPHTAVPRLKKGGVDAIRHEIADGAVVIPIKKPY